MENDPSKAERSKQEALLALMFLVRAIRDAGKQDEPVQVLFFDAEITIKKRVKQ